MQYDEECRTCLIGSQERLCKGLGTEEERMDFMRDVCNAFSYAPKGVAAPWFIPVFTESFARHFGIENPYCEIKERANRLSLEMLPELEKTVREAKDPLSAAMKVSRTGNFLDFAVLSEEQIEKGLDAVMQAGLQDAFDENEYRRFIEDLKTAKSMTILGDNAGEIVFDTVLVRELKRQFPGLEITYVVRGGNAQNDATMEDAEISGMNSLVRVIGNGSAIPGTELPYCSKELLEALHSADLILSKGQANFETLVNSGLNIYYMFLCKCPKFANRFGVPPMTGMFVNDRRNERFKN